MTTTEYPHQSEPGTVTILGPETFIDAARTVICHQGVNYYDAEQES